MFSPRACSAMILAIPPPAPKNNAALMIPASRTPSMCRIRHYPSAGLLFPKELAPWHQMPLTSLPRDGPADQHAQLVDRFQDRVRPVGVPLHQPEFYPAGARRVPVARRAPAAEVLVHPLEERLAGAAGHQAAAAGAQDGGVVPDGPPEEGRPDGLGDRRASPLGKGRQQVEDELVRGEDV